VNAPEKIPLYDVQSQSDTRNIPIDAVGIKGMRYPIMVGAGHRIVPTVATLTMTVGLGALVKGTHMSRFVELIEAQREPLNMPRFQHIVRGMLEKLETRSGTIEMRFPYFVEKTAPVSGVRSQLDYEVCWQGSASKEGVYTFSMQVMVPVTSLCPCSKEISEYGAHNQRSCVTIKAELLAEMPMEELIGMAERSASCELYGLLKRPDEKYVTERAYDNPKFVEDLVRDVAMCLNEDSRVGDYVIEAENFESIHNHSAFARIVRSKPADAKERPGHGLRLLRGTLS